MGDPSDKEEQPRKHIVNETLASIEDLYDKIAKLEVEMHELQFEAKIYRLAMYFSFVWLLFLLIDWIWRRFF